MKPARRLRSAALLPVFLLFAFPGAILAASAEQELMEASVSLSDIRSLQKGARVFVNYCAGCHAAAYMRYQRLARDLRIPEQALRENFMFGTDNPGDTMTSAMSEAAGVQYFGVAPPDLSLVARSRGADWLYTYMLSFYEDPGRPFGANNLVFRDTAMPHVLWELQGAQRPVYRKVLDAQGKERQVIERLELARPGALDEREYKKLVGDLVNFLVYLSEPIQQSRRRVGAWVSFYLLLLVIVTYLLKREYWRDVK